MDNANLKSSNSIAGYITGVIVSVLGVLGYTVNPTTHDLIYTIATVVAGVGILVVGYFSKPIEHKENAQTSSAANPLENAVEEYAQRVADEKAKMEALAQKVSDISNMFTEMAKQKNILKDTINQLATKANGGQNG